MRINNLSARLLVNERLVEAGYEPFPAELSYEEFAERLRRITAPTMAAASFVSRSDAVSYIRTVARHRQMIPTRDSKSPES